MSQTDDGRSQVRQLPPIVMHRGGGLDPSSTHRSWMAPQNLERQGMVGRLQSPTTVGKARRSAAGPRRSALGMSCVQRPIVGAREPRETRETSETRETAER